jgi:hypothetical protein
MIPLRYQVAASGLDLRRQAREEPARPSGTTRRLHKLWGDGELPPLTHDDIRAWLQNELERLRYELFELDRLDGDELRNKFIEELTLRSEGLPLYVQMVIDDLKRRTDLPFGTETACRKAWSSTTTICWRASVRAMSSACLPKCSHC